jgi:hypothetical protein
LFLDIALFKKGPQDVPASRLLFGLALVADILVGMLLLGLESSAWEAVPKVLLEMAMLLAFTWVTLAGLKLEARFPQTGCAMLGTDALISGFAVPLLAWMMAAENGAPGYLLLMLLMLWHLGVIAQILRNALECPLAVAIVMAIVYIGGSYQIMVLLFPPEA